MGRKSKSKSKSTCFFCQLPATFTCSFCGIARLCSEDHLRRHRPEQLCFPFKVSFDETKGRILLASRDISAMELIFYDDRPIIGPKFNDQPVCLKCLRPLKERETQPCSKCQWPVCAGKCGDRNGHSDEECAILAKGAQNTQLLGKLTGSCGYYRSISVLRLLLLRDKQPELYSDFCSLMHHNSERRRNSDLWSSTQLFVNDFLLNTCQMERMGFDDEDVDRATGVVWTNAFGHNGGKGGGGQAVFPIFSLISHDCTANCNHVVLPGKRLALQAKIAIAKGTELTIAYVSPIQSTLRRRSKLREKWFFECLCRRCSTRDENGSHASSLLCKAQRIDGNHCDGVLTLDDDNESWSCSKCSHSIHAQSVLDLENEMVERLQSISSECDASKTRLLLKELSDVLHPHHYLLVLLKRHLIVQSTSELASLSRDELEELKLLCEEVLEVLNIIDPGCSRDRGVLLRHFSEVSKFYWRKCFLDSRISQEQLAKRVQNCLILLEESQRCIGMLIKKDDQTP